MAHAWAMKYGKVDSNYNRENTVQLAWDYADAMQAEADKRKSKPELPSLQQTFIDGVEQPRYAPSCEEWQPDWSQAPEWANYIAVYSDYCNASYFEKEPKIISGYTWGGTDGKSLLTPIPVYTGNWQDSLRKRP